MIKLKEGLTKANEIAAWFGIASNTFSNTRKRKLKELEDYCSFEDLGRKGINIKEVYIDVYGGFNQDVKVYKREVERQRGLTSISAIVEDIMKEEPYCNYSESSVKNRMRKAGIIAYGVTKEENSHGIYGSREYKWVIKLYNEEYHYRFLADDEQELFDNLTYDFYKGGAQSKEELIQTEQKMALLDDELRDGGISGKEYLEERDRIRGRKSFYELIKTFKEQTGFLIVRGTVHNNEIILEDDEFNRRLEEYCGGC